MRFARALIASAGASTSLIAAGSVALFALSTLIAFNGWPSISEGTKAQTTTILAAPTAERTSSQASEPLQIASRPASERSAKTTSSVVVAHRVTTSGATRASVGGTVTSTSHSRQPDTQRPADKKPPAAGDPVREVATSVGNTTTTVTKGLGDTVRPVSPALADGVDQVGTTVQKVVGDRGETIGKILDPTGVGGN
jgi:hypothetical protein